MMIKSATFVKGVIGTDEIFEKGIPQIVFIGRSNVGKSSVINSLANQKSLVRVSSTPGRTQEINIFLINKSFYLVDVPGYGFAKVPPEVWHRIQKMIDWFLFTSNYKFKKVVLIVDAFVGPTVADKEMFKCLEEAKHDIVIVANKIDKIKKSEYEEKIQKIKNTFSKYKIIPYSAEKKIGVGELVGELLRP
ncbi:MAG: ribosome biogenesis GTP-binding protein YsxC [Candidatus Magasanikbacteria bacterium RIFOXYC2_FULL_42_28]|uniref:Probable GTP-binding protein EngB n=1 Tax=Candidatus Magasanikbacteria bacterium RIFOXYC2_FULL_42_28 TaxID=1798704 RepID=A0A1F6NWK1_9BACT|nr:MAG: ribosome biogenesis GTP-binding protein YsxC [Candidatus Magasanikbacteria bacterium RIFOXYC2_FULL_42_28]